MARAQALIRLAAALALVALSCASPRFGDCEVRCAERRVCPSGLECGADGFCHREGSPTTCAADLDASTSNEADGAVIVSGPAERVELRPLGEPAEVARHEPVAVSPCLSGGEQGREVAYSEPSEEVRSRAVVFPSYDAALAAQLELPEEPASLDLDLTESFDVDPAGSVSSSDGVDVLSTTIPAQHYGVFYRQAIEVHHVADLVAITVALDEYAVGQVAVVDWRFVADLGIGTECPPLPPPPSTLE
jgi:hypothetical protein